MAAAKAELWERDWMDAWELRPERTSCKPICGAVDEGGGRVEEGGGGGGGGGGGVDEEGGVTPHEVR